MEHFSSSWQHGTTNKMYLSDEDGACDGPSAVHRLWRSFRWWVSAENLGTTATSEADSCARNTGQYTRYAEPLPSVGWCSCVCSVSWWSGGCNHWDAYLSGTKTNHCIIMNTDVSKDWKNTTCDHMLGWQKLMSLLILTIRTVVLYISVLQW